MATPINSTELLNKVQTFMIDFANSKNIRLDREFDSVEQFKQFVIAFTFKTLREIGIETDTAFDIVFGDGAYAKLAEEVWAANQ